MRPRVCPHVTETPFAKHRYGALLAVVADEPKRALGPIPLDGDGLHRPAQILRQIAKPARQAEYPHVGSFGLDNQAIDLACDLVLDLTAVGKFILHDLPRVRSVADLAQVLILFEDRRALALFCLVEVDLVSAMSTDRYDAIVADVPLDLMTGVPLRLLARVGALTVVVDLLRGLILSQNTLPAINVWLHKFTLFMKPYTYFF